MHIVACLLVRLTRVVADSGAGSTNETFRNSELIFAIFKNFALKFSELTSIKVLENNCENKASLWTDFKNSFTWLMGMTNMNFGFINFFAPAISWSFFQKSKIKKWLEQKKVVKTKIHIFHAHQPREGIFWNPFILRPYFHNYIPELWSRCVHWILRQNC